jgi:hypothetical protein
MFEKKIIDNPLRKTYDRKETEKVYAVLKKEVLSDVIIYIFI